MKRIETLIEDVNAVLDPANDFSSEMCATRSVAVGDSIIDALTNTVGVRDKPRELGKLWPSDLGTSCARRIWYKFNAEELAEKMPSNAIFKFFYGYLIEEAALELAQIAGHTVTHQQERLEYDGTSGRIDAVIDGHMVDVKSISSYGFKEVKNATKITHDHPSNKFGYVEQVSFYYHAWQEKNDIPFDNEAYIWFIDKQNGTMCLKEVEVLSKEDLVQEMSKTDHWAHSNLDDLERLPDEKSGARGNRKLSITCSYCPFKHECWPGLRTFMYANGRPSELSVVKDTPRVLEVTR